MATQTLEKIPPGYEVVQAAPIPRLAGQFYDLLHERTGSRHIHLAVPDRNSYFCALYRTLPENSTGVAHIMEHCVSGGSRRFPPGAGADMYTKSLVTLINATTNADFTNYYFATRHPGDYMNWLEYIVDVSLFARMEHDTYLRQRGHFEFNKPQDPSSGLKFVGIIFNEMKAVFGSPARHGFRALNRALFPGHPYSHDAGGDPAEVPDLTYEDLLAFNRRFYHPGNACFLSRGNIPLSVILSKVDDVVGDGFPRREATDIPEVQRLDAPEAVEAPVPVANEAEASKGQVLVGWATTPSSDSYSRLLLQVATDGLIEGSAAPLRRAIEDSGLVQGVAQLTAAPLQKGRVALYLDGVDPASAPRIEELVLETLSEVARKGLDAELVDSAIARLELRRREQADALSQFLEAVVPPILYGGDPHSAVELDGDLERLDRELKSGEPLEELISAQLVDNPHRARVAMVPDSGFEERIRERETAWLGRVSSGLTEDDKKKIVADALRLAPPPKAPFEPRGLTAGESLVELKHPDSTIEDVAGVSVELFDQPTGGITYLNLRLNLAGLSEELVPYLGLFMAAIERRVRASSSRLDRVNVKNHLRVNPAGTNLLHWLELNLKARDRDRPELGDSVSEAQAELDFHPSVLKQLIAERSSSIEQGIIGEAQVQLRRLAGASLRRSSAFDDQVRGISQLIFLKRLGTSDDQLEQVEMKLQELRKRIFTRSRLSICFVGSPDPSVSTAPLIEALPQGELPPATEADALDGAKPHRARLTPLPVAFTCEAHSIPGLTDPDTPSISVLGHILWIGYLNPEARRIGAYGIDIETLPERGLFWISSRRDPQPDTTYRAFAEGISRFADGRWDGPKAADGVLAGLRVTDPVDSPASAARRTWIGRFTGHTADAWNDYRSRLLEVRDSDLKTVAEKYLVSGAKATLIGPGMIGEGRVDSRVFDEMIQI